MHALSRVLSVMSFAGIMLLFGVSSASAATIYANSSTGNDSTGDGSSGSPYKTFHQAYTAASSGDALDLTGAFTWTDSDETGDASTSGYTISKPLVLLGHGPAATILQAASSDNVADRRVFTIDSGVSTTILGVAIRYGKQGAAGGGCMYAGSGSTVTIDGADIYSCRTTNGSANGAGLQTDSGTLTVLNTSIHDNYVVLQGGGIDVYAGTLNVVNVTIFNNHQSHGSGGGAGVIVRNSATARFLNSTITGNTGSWGGGISLYYSPTTYFENTIVAGNTGNSLGYNDINGFFAGTINSLGSNIIGDYSSFPATTGDWKDTNRDGVYDQYLTGMTGSLNLDSAGRLNNSVNGTYTVAILTGSIAIDAATTTVSNGAFSVPTLDQRLASRSGATDIGAYEYNPAFPATFTLTYTAGAHGSLTGSTTQVVANGGDGVSVTAVPDAGYTFVSWSDDSTSVTRTDTSVAGDLSVTASFIDATSPDISSVTSTASSTSASLSWTTDEVASSQVVYGPSTLYGVTSTVADLTPLVTSHSVSIDGLAACATYHYRVISVDASGNSATSTDANFLTLGCVGSSPISTSTARSITNTEGGTVSLLEDASALVLTVPSGFSSSSANFQIKRLNATVVEMTAGRPDGYLAAGEHVYNLTAVTTSSGAISVFDGALTVTMSYIANDIIALQESDLMIFRWDDGAWTALSDCSVNDSLRQVSCSTTHFSTFQLFGQSITASVSASGGGGSGNIFVRPVALAGANLDVWVNGSNAASTPISQNTVRLHFNANPATVKGYAVSLRPDFAQTSILPYTSSTSFVLSEAYGTYVIYTKFYSLSGDASDVIIRSVVYGAPAPEISPSSAVRGLVRADAQAFTVTLSDEDSERLAAFIEFGTSKESLVLGMGERRAVIRDVFDTIGRAIPTSEIEKLIRGETIPNSRNLASEQVRLAQVRAVFRSMYGHDPNFKETNQNLAWNTLMYRIRFPRNIEKEKRGISKFKQIFRRTPTDPFQWATVRVLGYTN